MTLDCKKKNKNATKWRIFEEKNQNLLINLIVLGLTKLYFLSNNKTGGSVHGETNTQYAKKRSKLIG